MWPFLVCLGKMLWRAPRVLWVCRVPAISAIGGGLFISYLSQTRDLFADLGLQWWQWLGFFALLIVWAWIVHWAGRHALRLDDWVPDAHVPGALRRRAGSSCRIFTNVPQSPSRDCSALPFLHSWRSPWCEPT
jgi:hypothetical protein